MGRKNLQSPDKKAYAAAAVLTADLGGVVALSKTVGISGSFASMIIFVALMGLSIFVVREYWRS